MSLDNVREELGLTLGRSGKYRLLIFFQDSFSRDRMNRGIISLFLSGSPTDSEGDVKVFECPATRCTGVIDPVGEIGVCPKCRRTWPRNELIPEMAYDATVDGWSKHISRYLRALHMDCDVYMKRAKDSQSIIEAEGIARHDTHIGGDLLKKARRREEALYTAGRIRQDTQQGQDLEKAIRGFLMA